MNACRSRFVGDWVRALWMVISCNALLAVDLPKDLGPEDGGLRMRLVVERKGLKEGEPYVVRVDLYNVSEKDILLRSAWRDDSESGSVNEYLEAATHIETVPEIDPWVGGVRQGHRTLPQVEQVFKAGERLSIEWKSDGQRLKNRVSDPGKIQNPEFPLPGLYSVHARLEVVTAERTAFLRSNEVLYAFCGGFQMPKHTFGRFMGGDPESKTGSLSLGASEKVVVGDQFLIGYAKTGQWRMTITDVYPHSSSGRLEPLPAPPGIVRRDPPFPLQLAPSTLAQKK